MSLPSIIRALAILGYPSQYAGGGSPTGAASGDLSGTYPAPSVAKVAGQPVYGATTGLIEQRNGSTAQGYQLYNSYTDNSNFERGGFQWSGNVLQIGTTAGGTGSTRFLRIVINGTALWSLTTSAITPVTDNAYDLGTSAARVRTAFLRSLVLQSQLVTAATTLSATSPYRTIFNSASAVAQPLPASPYDGQTLVIANVGAGAVTVSYTGRAGATTKVLAQDSAATFAYSASLGYWTVE